MTRRNEKARSRRALLYVSAGSRSHWVDEISVVLSWLDTAQGRNAGGLYSRPANRGTFRRTALQISRLPTVASGPAANRKDSAGPPETSWPGGNVMGLVHTFCSHA